MDLLSEIEEPFIPFTIPADIDSTCIWDDQSKVFKIRIPDGSLIYSRDFFTRDVSDRVLEYLQKNDSFDPPLTDWGGISEQDIQKINFLNIKWKQELISIYGKVSLLPRLTAWYGDADRSYSYSGIKSQANSWNEGLLYIKRAIEQVSGTTFNSVLLNWYRNGDDHLGWHADNEKELGSNPTIGSVNLGETRDFVLRRNGDPSKKITIPLEHGSLLVMCGAMQHYWEHSVPKRRKIKTSRINLTFRQIQTNSR
jgi:alkylated DNA repair dioxygenase AlkB